jgi:hypothetical protein
VAKGVSCPSTNARGPASRSYWLRSAGAGSEAALLGVEKDLPPRGVTFGGDTGGDTRGATDGEDPFPEEPLFVGGVVSATVVKFRVLGLVIPAKALLERS